MTAWEYRMNDRPCTELDDYLDRLTIDKGRDSKSVLSTLEVELVFYRPVHVSQISLRCHLMK